MTGTLKYYTPEVRMGSATDKMSYQVRALPVAASATDAWLLTNYRDGSVQVDRIPASDLGCFATVRYLGNAAPMTSVQATTIRPGYRLAVGCRATTSLNGLVGEAARGAKSVAVWLSIINATEYPAFRIRASVYGVPVVAYSFLLAPAVRLCRHITSPS